MRKINYQKDYQKIFAIAVPLVLQQLFFQLQIYVDRAMLGHVNSEYFSVVGNATAPYYTVLAIIGAICGATTIFVSQSLGAKKISEAKGYAECSFIGNSILPFAFFILFFFFSGIIFSLMGVKSPILEYSITYLQILSFTLLIFGIESTSQSIVQGIGVTKIIMVAGIVRNLLNILFDWLLIYGKFGFPQLDIKGAAYASLIANLIAAPIIVVYAFKSKRVPFKMHLKNVLKVKWDRYKKIIRIGLPAGFESSLWNIGNIIVMSFLNLIDMMSAGIYSLIFSFEMLPNIIYMGFARSTLTLVGQKTGEKDHKLAIIIGFRCMRIALTICIVIAFLFLAFKNSLLSLFTDDVGLVNSAAQYMLIICITMFPRSINNVIGLGIQGMGDTKWMLYGQIFGTTLVVVVSYILIFVAGLGMMGLFITFFIDELIRSIINILRFWKGREFFRLKPFAGVMDSKTEV